MHIRSLMTAAPLVWGRMKPWRFGLIAVCLAVDSGSSSVKCSRLGPLQSQKRVSISLPADGVVRNLFGFGEKKNVATLCRLVFFLLAGSNAPSIRLQWLYVVESHTLQSQNIVKFNKYPYGVLSDWGRIVLVPPSWDFSVLHPFMNDMVHQTMTKFRSCSHLIDCYQSVSLYQSFHFRVVCGLFPVWDQPERDASAKFDTSSLNFLCHSFTCWSNTHMSHTASSFFDEYLQVSHIRYPRNE